MMPNRVIGKATFICLRHDQVPGQEGPFTEPVFYWPGMEGPLGRPKINCPVCSRGYALEPDSLVFYSDRPLKLLRMEFEPGYWKDWRGRRAK